MKADPQWQTLCNEQGKYIANIFIREPETGKLLLNWMQEGFDDNVSAISFCEAKCEEIRSRLFLAERGLI